MADVVSVLPTLQLVVDANCVTLDTNLSVVVTEGLILTNAFSDATPVIPRPLFLWYRRADVVSHFMCLEIFS